ncbi:MAG: hypothetical protein AB7O74_05360 [Candidatus Nanopelagicales bacterium]
MANNRSGRPPYLLRAESWPVVAASLVVFGVVWIAGLVADNTALLVVGWVLLSLWIVGLLVRALAIETIAALAKGETYRDGFWRFVRLIVVSALNGLLP